jgi:ribonucleotide reductase beta subunit family protein with ferritin-like domain
MMSVFKESGSYRPFQYPWAIEAADKQEIDMYWSIKQVNLQDDVQQYNSRDGLKTATVSHDQNKNILDKTLCLFTEMDRTVGMGYSDLLRYICNNEIRVLFFRQANREATHQSSYALAAETFGFSDKDWTAFAEYAEMREKLDVMGGELIPEGARDELVAAIKLTRILLGEGIGLFGAFSTLLNMKRHGILVGFNDINQWSLKDENEHVINNIRVVFEMRKDLSQDELVILRKATYDFVDAYKKAEYKYLDLVFEMGGSEGLTLEQQKDYIHYLGQLRLYELGYIGLTEVPPNPLEWMEWMLSANAHSAFFEKKVVDYVHGQLEGKVNYNKYKHLLDKSI